MTEAGRGSVGHGAVPADRTHGIRLRRLRLAAAERSYDIDFRGADGSARALSVIAGAFGTGKTTVLEFIDYCLGASDHPRHPEVMPRVRSAALEVDLSGAPHVVERTVGEPSTWATVRSGRLDEQGEVAKRRPLRPAAHPSSLSSLLLSYCKLEGIHLRDAPDPAGSPADPLSFRELMWLCLLLGDRLDGDLLFERQPVRHLTLRQVVDVVFDVHDDRPLRLGRQIRELEERAAAARVAYAAAQELVEEQSLGDTALLDAAREGAMAEQAAADAELAELDRRTLAAAGFADELRDRYRQAVEAAEEAVTAVRDGETQLRRMLPLRVQYADDVSKLTMLSEAEEVFEPVRLTACPVCHTVPATTPAIAEGRCGLCQTELPAEPSGAAPDVGAELAAAKTRLAELTRWVEELEGGLPALRTTAEQALAAEVAAAAEVDAATAGAVTPFLGERDALARRRQGAAVVHERAAAGLRLVASLRRRAQDIERQEATIASLREELAEAGQSPPDRSAVIGRISERFAELLAEWRYPKLAEAYVDERLVPHVRGQRYTAASSGGRTLIALAWQLAIFEVAWETNSSHPGFLLIDSPQRSLVDNPVAGAATIARVYRHLRRWLAGPGTGAQIVVADNAPPAEAEEDVIVRFSRRSDQPPYGLIDDETD
ncbi:DNA recombination protein RecN [Phytohabitans sp. ZYX-F-186]|uniref:DNA recombination protein RecN n=1 Tax=Phytohabitans maris TaxID=3071409 RepID=A0ABU0ZJK8_9ACTN|nr:DNA recombination protein RecN [Phytohabitans sp. ZYX-F-186]MDQ7907234.1 DNA recombination protein RecN [Phytohabitans sp. ZYX-F-186]